MSARRAAGWRWWHVPLLVVLTACTYAGSLDGDFVSDDSVSVVRNEVIRGLDGAHLTRIFTTFDDANYIPLKVLTVAIDYHVWGLDPRGHHVTNVLIHLGCALLVYGILRRLRLSGGAAVTAALVWSLHPLQVESVAWISERKNVLSGLFFFAAFHAYLRFRERRSATRYVVLLALYLMALLSKMNTVVLPALMLVFEVAWHHRLPRWAVRAALPLCALGAVVVWYNLAGNPMHGQEWHGGSPRVTWLSSTVIVFRYLGAVLVPIGLAPRYEVALYGSVLDAAALASILGLVLLLVATWWLLVARRREAFWVAWFFICLAPMLNIVPFRGIMHDRFLYLPLVGAVVLVIGWLDTRVRTAQRRRIATLAAAALVTIAALLTLRQVEIWDSDLTLWQAEATTAAFVAAEPGSRIPDHDRRRAFLAEGVRRHPTSAALLNNHAGLLFAEGRIDEALPGLEHAAMLAPAHPSILVNLGRAYALRGRLDEAAVTLARAAEIERYRVYPHLHLARVHLARRDGHGATAALAAAEGLLPPEMAARAFARERAALERLTTGG